MLRGLRVGRRQGVAPVLQRLGFRGAIGYREFVTLAQLAGVQQPQARHLATEIIELLGPENQGTSQLLVGM
jgi:hypothetical protein